MLLSKTITVKHVVSLKKVTVKKSAKKLVYKVTLKGKKVLKYKKVTLKVKGKTLKAKTSAGKSPLFISLIIFGYICGIIGKIINIPVKPLNYVFIFYCINLVTTSFDLCLNLYYTNKENFEWLLSHKKENKDD